MEKPDMNVRDNRFPLRCRVIAAALLLSLSFVAVPAVRAAANDDAAILPYLDEGTFFVARIDVDRVDHAALTKLMERGMETTIESGAIPENLKAQIKENAKKDLEETK